MIRGHIRCTLYEILPPDAFLNAKNPVDMHDFVIVYFDQQKASSYQLIADQDVSNEADCHCQLPANEDYLYSDPQYSWDDYVQSTP